MTGSYTKPSLYLSATFKGNLGLSPKQHCQDWVSSLIGNRHMPWESGRSTSLPKYGGSAMRRLKPTAGTLGNCPVNVAADSSLVRPDQFPCTAPHTLLLGSPGSSTLPQPALCITVTSPSLLRAYTSLALHSALSTPHQGDITSRRGRMDLKVTTTH